MRYEHVRRLNSVESAWLRLKMRFHNGPSMGKPPLLNPCDLSDHEKRDIGLPEPVRYVDWKVLREKGWL
ncbi:hypothetical protein [Microvirga terricola]|uniref:Transposase n=1 Tax=Microvirga terricola TaxID=2719797 RepID=A0ABX0VF54_9HYPH|nr:hypothetical protein [Microvirga terricola]NIX77570.1 hypothetical protein [Microvirga terricola]